MVLMMILYASLGHKIAARYKMPTIPAEKVFLMFLVVTAMSCFDWSLYAVMSKECCYHVLHAIFVDWYAL